MFLISDLFVVNQTEERLLRKKNQVDSDRNKPG